VGVGKTGIARLPLPGRPQHLRQKLIVRVERYAQANHFSAIRGGQHGIGCGTVHGSGLDNSGWCSVYPYFYRAVLVKKGQSYLSIWMNISKSLFRRLRTLGRTISGQGLHGRPCYWRTDIHSHLLPGVDDGVSTQEDVMECLHQLATWGIKHVVTTPHVSRDIYPNSRATLLAGQAALRKMIYIHRIPITIEVAAEYLLDDLFMDLLDTNELLTFGTERFLLVEIGWGSPPPSLLALLFQLQIKGYQPVLAHPERYRYYHTNLKALEELRNHGCLFQVNWGSLTGRYGPAVKAQAHRIMKNNWTDFIGSDLHKPTDLAGLSEFFFSPDYKLLATQPLLNQLL
jgi:protein-tyrosine phosphatase